MNMDKRKGQGGRGGWGDLFSSSAHYLPILEKNEREEMGGAK